MKYIKKLTWLLVLGAGLMTASCSDNDDVEIPGGLAIDKEQIEIGAEGGSEQLAIAASQNWVSSVVEPWLMLTPANGVGSTTATVIVDSTLTNGRRTTDIAFIGDILKNDDNIGVYRFDQGPYRTPAYHSWLDTDNYNNDQRAGAIDRKTARATLRWTPASHSAASAPCSKRWPWSASWAPGPWWPPPSSTCRTAT